MEPRHPWSDAAEAVEPRPTLRQMVTRSHGGHLRVLSAISRHEQLQTVDRGDLTSLSTLRRWGAVTADGAVTNLGLELLAAMRRRNGRCGGCGRGLLGSSERNAGTCSDCDDQSKAARP